MTGGQRHLVQLADIPGADDEAARVWIAFQSLDDLRDLIDGSSIRRGPGAPLFSIDRSKLAILVGPFVPDGDAMRVQVAHIGRTFEEPEQLVNDRFQVKLLGSEQWKAGREIEAELRAEQAQRASVGAVAFFSAAAADVGEQVEIGLHESESNRIGVMVRDALIVAVRLAMSRPRLYTRGSSDVWRYLSCVCCCG